MQLPDDFSPAEHLQDTIKLTMNREVREWFRDVRPDDWDPDLNSLRARLRVACTHLEEDTFEMTVGRMQLFYFLMGQAQALQAPVYEAPFIDDPVVRKYKPQIHLYFREPYTNENKGRDLVKGTISFRLMREESTTLTQSEVNTYARRIQTLFAATRFTWRKGKIYCSYLEKEKGYHLQLLVRDRQEGRKLIEQVLDIQNHSPDWQYMYVSENQEPAQRYPNVPGTIRILNRTEKKPQWRPIRTLGFRYAYLSLWGRPKPITLVDTTGRFPNAVISS